MYFSYVNVDYDNGYNILKYIKYILQNSFT